MLRPFPAYVDPRDAKLRRRGIRVRIAMMVNRMLFSSSMLVFA